MKKSAVAPALLGLLALAAALVFGLLPQSETYSDFGLQVSGVVDVNCGSVLSPETEVDFRDYNEGLAYEAESSYLYEPPIFEGQTATQVCDEKLSRARTTALVALGIGALLLVVAFFRGNKNKNAPPDPFAYGSVPPPPPSDHVASPPQPPPPTVEQPAPIVAPLAPTPQSSAVTFSDGRMFGLEVPLVVGRAPAQPDGFNMAAAVAVDDMTVSKTHLAVGQTGDDVWIEDLQSRNGVSVRSSAGTETQIAPGRRAILDDGDRVIVGDTTSFVVGQRTDAPANPAIGWGVT